MYAEGRIVGKSGALQQDVIRRKIREKTSKNVAISAALIEFCGSAAGAPAVTGGPGIIWPYNFPGRSARRMLRSHKIPPITQPNEGGRHGQKTDQEQRAIPTRRQTPAARRGFQFPLLGRGAHHLCEEGRGRAHHRPRRQCLRRLSHGLWSGDPRLCASGGRSGRPRRHGSGRRVRAVHRTRVHRGRAHFQNGAGRRARALLQFRHRSGHGGAAPGARLHGQGRLCDPRGRLSRAVRCGHVVHAHGQMVAGRATPK